MYEAMDREIQQMREREREGEMQIKRTKLAGDFKTPQKSRTRIVPEVWEELASRRDHNLNV